MSVDFWDKVAERYAARPVRDAEAYEATLARVRDWLGPHMRVLELGCGTGSTALRLADAAGHIRGVDYSPEMIRIAQGSCDAANLRFDCASVETALEQGPYDAILAFNLLHLLGDLDGSLTRARAALDSGGLLITKTPCLGWKLWLRPLIRVLQMAGKMPPFGFVTPGGLERAIREAGFEILETGDYPKSLPSRFIVARRV